jgi:hypothetical protein
MEKSLESIDRNSGEPGFQLTKSELNSLEIARDDILKQLFGDVGVLLNGSSVFSHFCTSAD